MNLICGPIKMIWFFWFDFLHFSFCKLSEKTNLVAYHFYLFVGKFPKLFNFSESKEKSYLGADHLTLEGGGGGGGWVISGQQDFFF